MMSRTLYRLAFGCLGANATATTAVKVLFCLSTGWNREQIALLPADPYAFRTDELAGVADEAFLTAYKARARQYVSAYLERGFRNFVPDEEQLVKLWEEETGESGIDGGTLVNDASVLAIFDRYERMVSPIRHLSSAEIRNRFFLALTPKGVTTANETIPSYRLGPVASMKGVGYQTIRQTFINVTRRRIGSLALTKHQTNHANEATILAHYDDASIQRELTEAHAFWQNCLQAELMIGDPDLKARFNVPETDFEWFSNLSIMSGISASLTIVPKRLTVTDTGYFEFAPSVTAYVGIYLHHRSLVGSRRKLGNKRFQVQAIPIIGILKAIRRHAFANGLRDLYREAVHQAIRRLRNGEIVLPRALDIFR